MAQRVKCLPVMQETLVRSLGQEGALEKEMATHSSILAWRIPMDRGAWGATVHGVAKSQIGLSDQAQHSTGPLRWGESENSGMFYFLGLQNPCGQ